MTVIINAGSGTIPASGDGWTNTYQRAEQRARGWLDTIGKSGIRDVWLDLPGEDLGDGRWRFAFRHEVTGAAVDLDTHGIDDLRAYERQWTFPPRVYWDGSSSADPVVEDWLADGFEVVKTLRPAGGA